MGSLPHVVEDCMGVLQVYSDGTIFRSQDIDSSATPFVNDKSVLHKDYIFDEIHNLNLRIYKPTRENTLKKLPIVFFFHGGGFCLGSLTWPLCHNFCISLASNLKAIVIAPDYRLAPEHRLPAAMEDGVGVMKWVQAQVLKENGVAWLKDNEVDLDRVFVMGDSSGGNIAHYLAVYFKAASTELLPLQIRGYVLIGPFFGGLDRTKSEEGPAEVMLTLELLDRFWRLSIPVGENRDHPLANPFGPKSLNLEQLGLDPILVLVGGCELLKDRGKDYASRLRNMGKKIECMEFEGKQHGFFTNYPYSDIANEVFQVIERFIVDNSH